MISFARTILLCATLLAQIGIPSPGPGTAHSAAGGAPSLSASAGFAGSGLSGATTSLRWASGDLVVAGMVGEGAVSEVFTAPTATGLTFSSVMNHTPASDCGMAIYTATAGSSGSSAVTGNISVSVNWNMWVWVFHNHGGVGNSTSQFTATKTVSLTPTGGAHGAIIWVVGDWSATASPVAAPTSPNETTRQATQNGKHYSYVTGDITDQTSDVAVSYGVNYTSSGPFSIGVLEIKHR